MSEKISRSEVRHMALLSRLDINEEEEILFCRQFGAILDHMNILATVDTENIEPLYNPLHDLGMTRLDIANDLRTRSEILSNAPETDGECFIVPKIV